MWLGILSDLPLFYQTCPVGPTLLGKPVPYMHITIRNLGIDSGLHEAVMEEEQF